MQISAGMAAGFVAGVAIAGGALIWLRVQENVTRDREAAHVAELDAQVQRLEQTVARLSDRVASIRQIAKITPMAITAAPASEALQPTANHPRSVAAADSMVDQAIQSGRWSREQAAELSSAVSDLDVREQSRILARVSAAINAGQMQVETP